MGKGQNRTRIVTSVKWPNTFLLQAMMPKDTYFKNINQRSVGRELQRIQMPQNVPQDKIRFQIEMQQYTANQQAQQQQNAALQAQAQQQLPPVDQQHYLPAAPASASGIDPTAAPQHNHYGLDPQQYQHYDAYAPPQYHQ